LSSVPGDWGYYINCPICGAYLCINSKDGKMFSMCECGAYLSIDTKTNDILVYFEDDIEIKRYKNTNGG